jgi:dienelactone hydrolase
MPIRWWPTPGSFLAFLLTTCFFCGGCSMSAGHHAAHPADAPTGIIPPFKIVQWTAGGRTFDVYTLDQQPGPAVLFLHEVPALTPRCLALAQVIASRGFKVYAPRLFGAKPTPRREPMGLRAFLANTHGLLSACLDGPFSCLSQQYTGPIVNQIVSLSAQIHALDKDRPMGVIGLCISGSLALAVASHPWIGAAVVGQPALPLVALSQKAKRAIPVDAELAALKGRRVPVPVLALRFSEDKLSPRPRMEALWEQLHPHIQVIEILSGDQSRQVYIPKDAHAVLTEWLAPPEAPTHPTRQALQRVLDFFSQNLVDARSGPAPPSQGCDWTTLNR